MDRRLRITREQLANFLGNNQDLVIRFEQLLESVGQDIPNFLSELDTTIASLSSADSSALASIDRLSNAIEGLSLAPQAKEKRQVESFVPPVSVARPAKKELLVSVGFAIPRMRAVYLSNVDADNLPRVSRYVNNNRDPKTVLGITISDIGANSTGYVATSGCIVHGLDTSGLNTGELYTTGLEGEITSVAPGTGNNIVQIGYCLKVDSSNGIILVDVDWNDSINSLSDTSINTPNDGDVLVYMNNEWVNVNGATGSFTNANGDSLNFENGLITGIS